MRVLATTALLLSASAISCAHMQTQPGTPPAAAMLSVAATPAPTPSSQPIHAITRDEQARTIARIRLDGAIFGFYEPSAESRKPDAQYVFRPAVAVTSSTGKPTGFISWPDLTGHEWVMAAYLPSKRYYWGFADSAVEGRARELVVIWSQDGGKTWARLPSLIKSHYSDELTEFTVDEHGTGHAVIRRSGEGEGLQAGYDVFTTPDFGQSWSRPAFIPSDVASARPADDEDCQPELQPHRRIPAKCALPSSGSAR